MKALLFFLIVLLCLLQYRLWFGDGNLQELRGYQQRIEDLEQESRRLENRNGVLEAQIIDLRNGNQALEERAREELGMIREGEIFFQLIEEANEK